MAKKSHPKRRNKVAARTTALRRKIYRHLSRIGFAKGPNGFVIKGSISKQRIRDLHALHRKGVLNDNADFLADNTSALMPYFASGRQINPLAIEPELVEVESGSVEARLFRFACLSWSVPVSRGFGRRLRFLVKDKQNGCLIGLFALGDPVFNLSARDSWVGWTNADRVTRLVHVMDAYTLGAVAPYSFLLGGKLVGALLGSNEVKRAYERKYLGREAVISGKANRARLVLLTTTSALGRSSIYNRLKMPGGPQFIHIGATRGFGHFHLEGGLFDSLRAYLEEIGHPYAEGHRFGSGPNWKIRVARAALEHVGVAGNSVLRHGVSREVYAIPLAVNWREILLGTQRNIRSTTLPLDTIVAYCKERWLLPRAERDHRYADYNSSSLEAALRNGGPGPSW